jgi:hypothetical protein
MAGACALVGLAACTAPGPTTTALPTRTKVAPAVAPSVDPNAASAAVAAKDAALKAYHGYLDEYVTLAASATWDTKALNKYTADPLTQQALVKLRALADAGHVMKGEPTSHPVVTGVNTSTSPATVLISDCVGVANWTEVVEKSGKPVDGAPIAYQSVSAVVVDYGKYGWLVQQSNEAKATAC